jgi:hypothetical protein
MMHGLCYLKENEWHHMRNWGCMVGGEGELHPNQKDIPPQVLQK